ncbi:uncharacterized protein LAESUDRAFT_279024 [Laetiporus sulphureus 93-53]|uniref:Uncharacterized protein n=1 Tax=Laetiporus sulphureus 93-53 TaxID=1314785 RepID=A0A165HDY5_9APHY|nr:uncharacterized protein LAESUDRAFT_279024 [Laetiporus sulphureus 93-53]KZT11607.1 hypothetical protein LAESUDRAFT_279024 [Laetiporus sulphureus 93-53]
MWARDSHSFLAGCGANCRRDPPKGSGALVIITSTVAFVSILSTRRMSHQHHICHNPCLGNPKNICPLNGDSQRRTDHWIVLKMIENDAWVIHGSAVCAYDANVEDVVHFSSAQSRVLMSEHSHSMYRVQFVSNSAFRSTCGYHKLLRSLKPEI